MKKFIAVAAVTALFCTQSADAYQFNGNRWNRTAISGPGLLQGDPTTITWGFVPDGTLLSGVGPSDFISKFDSRFGAGPGGSDLTQRPWFTYFEQSFDRFAQLSGLSYVYEPADDGVTQGTSTFAGFVGTRADVRIGGDFLDGPSGVLAFNNFPQNGDMTLDTGDMGFFGTALNNYRRLRNVVMHEHGHGTGYFHVESSNSGQLMEPFIQTFFDGPQFDDILGIHRGYGDFYEKSNGGAGNNVAGNATDLGVILNNNSAAIGSDADVVFVQSSETDFVSIDDNGDIDFYAFTVNGPSLVDITLEPVGPTYNQGPQGGSQSPFVTSQLSNLEVALFDTNGTSLLAQDNSGGLGQIDSILDYNLSASGEYFVRVTGAANMVQMYELSVAVESGVVIDPGDFDGNGAYECADVDALVAAIVSGDNDPTYDLTGEGVVNNGDLQEWLGLAGAANLDSQNPYLLGDANLDGTVDGQDFVLWNANKFDPTAQWCAGDFNADGLVDGQDFVVWNQNKFTSADGHAAAVPEPAGLLAMLLGLGFLGWRNRG